jgi:hypothetical protein
MLLMHIAMDPEIILQKLDILTTKINNLIEAYKSEFREKSKWISKQETMRILECSERTLQTLRDKHMIRFTNPLGGSKFFYLRKDVDSLFEKNVNGKI